MNKNKIFGSIAVLAIAAMIAFNVSIYSQEKGLSDITLANVEALAQNEDDADCSDGWPRPLCKIWDVSIPCGQNSCSTGGTWKCPCGY